MRNQRCLEKKKGEGGGKMTFGARQPGLSLCFILYIKVIIYRWWKVHFISHLSTYDQKLVRIADFWQLPLCCLYEFIAVYEFPVLEYVMMAADCLFYVWSSVKLVFYSCWLVLTLMFKRVLYSWFTCDVTSPQIPCHFLTPEMDRAWSC